MESVLLKWNWVLARSSLDQYFSCTWYQEKPICYLRIVLSKNGILVGNGSIFSFKTNWLWVGIRIRYKMFWFKVSKRFETKGKDRILIFIH